MADYYPLIVRAVAGLDKSTGEARRALYERARGALLTQLRGVEPALSEADITRERLALEEAIRKVEAEAARRPRKEPAEAPVEAPAPPLPRFDKPSSFAPPPQPEAPAEEAPPPPDWDELRRELDGLASPEPAASEVANRDPSDLFAPEPPSEPVEDRPFRRFEAESRSTSEFPSDTTPSESTPPESELPIPPRRFDKRFATNRPSIVDEGLKGFRDVMAETEDLGSAAASASRSARETREAFSALPASGEMERIEPRAEPRLDPRIGSGDTKPRDPELPPPPRADFRAGGRARPMPPPQPARDELEEPQQQQQHLRSGLGGVFRKVAIFAVLLALVVAAVFAYREWGSNLTAMFQSTKAPVTQASKEPQTRPKIADRIGGAPQDQTGRPGSGSGAAVAQRAVLYDLGPTPQDRKEYVGSVIWRTETVSPGPGQPPDLAVKAEVEIPERHMRMSMTIRRNLDQSLPASHTIEILFSTPPDFPQGGVADIAGVLMEEAEQSRGVQLAGMRVKVTNGFFLVGLSSVDTDVKRNVLLLKDRPWMHIRIAYTNGQRAVLAIEKGVPGDRVMEEALNAWSQPPQGQR